MPAKKSPKRTTAVNTSVELETAVRILQTVKKQVDSYSLSLEKILLLRKELSADKNLAKRIEKSPESLAELFIERGIPEILAYSMAAEDIGELDIGRLSRPPIWTWDCCCTGCCITDIIPI